MNAIKAREYLDEHPELERIICELKRAGAIGAIKTWGDLRALLTAEDAEALIDYLRDFRQVFEPAQRIQ